MGLDMYLSAKRYLWSHEDSAVEVSGVDIPEGFELKELVCRAAYWRKANQIHKWFVDNVQDGEDECNPYHVSRDQLVELLGACQSVKDDPKLVEKLLPPCEGFFFGSQKIDEWYWQDIDHTIEVLTKLLKLDLQGWEFEYRSSW